jgi:Ran GTPase-activating protein (RanGAP) involved in mRNA processing and transport
VQSSATDSDLLYNRLEQTMPPARHTVTLSSSAVDQWVDRCLENDPTLTQINLQRSDVAARGIQLLVDSLRNNKHVQKIELQDNGLCTNGASTFMAGIKLCPSLTSINLGFNGISSLHELGPASLATLSLQGNSLGSDGTLLLAKAIIGRASPSSLTALDLSSTSMGAAGAAAIAEVLELGLLRSIDLSANRLMDEGAGAIAEALTVDGALSSLSLSGNSISDQGVKVLQRGLLNNTKLTQLDLSTNLVTTVGANVMADLLLEAVSALRTVVLEYNQGVTEDQLAALKLESTVLPSLRQNVDVSQVKTLSLSGRCLGDRCAQHIGRVLSSNMTLESLDISDNKLGDGAAFSFSQMLQNNRALTELNLRQNRIGNDGAESLLQVCLSKPLLRLNLDANDVGDDVLCVLALNYELYELGTNSQTMHTLDMSNMNSGDGAMRALASTLFGNTNLQRLVCGGNSAMSTRGIVSLMQALEVNATLTHLDLTGDDIGAAGATCIGKLLPVNHGLRTLVLRENGIGDEGAAALADGVKRNGQLTELDVALNELTPIAVEAIFKALWEWDEQEEEKKVAKAGAGKNDGKTADGRAVVVEPFNRTLAVLDLGGNQLMEPGGLQVVTMHPRLNTLPCLFDLPVFTPLLLSYRLLPPCKKIGSWSGLAFGIQRLATRQQWQSPRL